MYISSYLSEERSIFRTGLLEAMKKKPLFFIIHEYLNMSHFDVGYLLTYLVTICTSQNSLLKAQNGKYIEICTIKAI